MSSMVLLKDHQGRKAGQPLEVPFLEGRQLIKAGIARYATDKPKKAAPAALPMPEVQTSAPRRPENRRGKPHPEEPVEQRPDQDKPAEPAPMAEPVKDK